MGRTSKHFQVIYCSITILFMTGCNGQTSNSSAEQKVFQEIQESYIDANAPAKNQFDSLLSRDLKEYFTPTYGQVNIKWELLRKGATQSGVAYPKYYLWTKVYNADSLVSEGAVRVAGMEKKSFDVTDYVTITEIKNKSVDIYTIFPGQVCEKIKSIVQ
jgi:hypothetical protein